MEGFDASGVLTVEEPLAKPWDAFTRLEQCRFRNQHTHRPLSSSFLGLPYRILNTNHKKEVLRGLWVQK